MGSIVRSCAALAALVLSGTALAAEGHVHGKAVLNVSVEGEHLILALESPLDNVLGFERLPKYEKDFAKVKEMAALLRQADKHFVATPAAQCKATGVKLTSAGIDPALLGEKGVAQKPADEHVDLDAEFTFACAKPAELKGVQVNLFDSFKRLRQIEASVVTEKRQAAAKLTPKARALSW